MNWHVCPKCKAEWLGGAETECPECGQLLYVNLVDEAIYFPDPSIEAALLIVGQ